MTPETIGEIRWASRLTQDQLADILDVSVKTISRWEKGQAHPSRRQVEILEAIEKSFRYYDLPAIYEAEGPLKCLWLLLGMICE